MNALEPEEIAHLQNLATGGLLRTITPEHVAEKFIKLGYARKAAGGLVATDGAHKLLIGRK